MRRISIDNGIDSVTLLPDLEFTIQPQFVGERADMASGRTVFDFVGTKTVLTIPTGWLKAEDLIKLQAMIVNDHVLTINYPGLGGDKTGKFYIDPPALKCFKYGPDGISQWYGVTLTATEYEVVK